MRTTGRTLLLVIDPQRDFVSPEGALAVRGADADMDRVAGLLDRSGDRIDEVWVSLDAHHVLDIAHPGWWRDASGQSPKPFTVITADDVVARRFWAADPSVADRSLAYLRALGASGRYPHVVWPEHCLIGDPGGDVWPALSAAIHRWERRRGRNASYVIKGSNPFTEHFSAVRAEVPDPDDVATERAAQALVAAAASVARTGGTVVVAGEARSHCVANTVRDLCAAVAALGVDGFPERIALLADAMSDVGGFERFGEAFAREATAAGMRTTATDRF